MSRTEESEEAAEICFRMGEGISPEAPQKAGARYCQKQILLGCWASELPTEKWCWLEKWTLPGLAENLGKKEGLR